MKLKRIDVLGLNMLMGKLWQITLDLGLKNFKARYFIQKNIKIIADEVKIIGETGYNEWDKDRVELVKACAKKDDKGEPVIEGNAYKLADQADFEKKYEELKVKHKALFDFLETEYEFKPHLIKLEDVPDEWELIPMDVNMLMELIAE